MGKRFGFKNSVPAAQERKNHISSLVILLLLLVNFQTEASVNRFVNKPYPGVTIHICKTTFNNQSQIE